MTEFELITSGCISGLRFSVSRLSIISRNWKSMVGSAGLSSRHPPTSFSRMLDAISFQADSVIPRSWHKLNFVLRGVWARSDIMKAASPCVISISLDCFMDVYLFSVWLDGWFNLFVRLSLYPKEYRKISENKRYRKITVVKEVW